MSCRNFPFVWPKVPTLKSIYWQWVLSSSSSEKRGEEAETCMHVSPHYLAVCLVDNNWFLWWGWYDAMKNSYFSVQGEILWLAHYDVTIRIYLCCPYFGETVQRGEGLLHTHRTIWAELQTDSSLYQNGSLLLNISWGEVYNPPSNTLTSAQNTSLDWKTWLADKLMVNDSEFGGINYDLSVVLWCPPPTPGRIFLWSLSNTRRDLGGDQAGAGPVMGTSFQT